MGILIAFLYVVEVLVGMMLIAIILVQKSKGGGLGTGFGSAMGESLFGSHASKVLTKITIILASIFVVNTLVLDKLGHRGSSEGTFRVEEEAPAPGGAGLPQGGLPGFPPSLPASGETPMAGPEPVVTPVPSIAPPAAPAPVSAAPSIAPPATPAPVSAQPAPAAPAVVAPAASTPAPVPTPEAE